LLAAAIGIAQAAETNGRGGGRWREAATWGGHTVPTGADAISVLPGDRLELGGASTAHCQGIEIQRGGRLSFGPNGARLVCRGDVIVDGVLSMGPGAELLIDCPQNMRYGMLVGSAGFCHCRGSSGFDRNCRISAAQPDGRHNTYVRLDRGASASFRFCEISHLGGSVPKGSKARYQFGLFFLVGVELTGCWVHHCQFAVHLITGGAITIQHNLFTDNRRGLTLYRPRGVTVVGNRFVGNQTGLAARGKHTEAQCVVTDNLFEGNRVGMDVHGLLGPASFHGNTYVNNEVGLRINSANAPIALECFAGNEHAVELVTGIVGARLTQCDFGTFQHEAMPNKAADIIVGAPGPADLLMHSCRLDSTSPVLFATDPKHKAQALRRVVSRDHSGNPGDDRQWGGDE